MFGIGGKDVPEEVRKAKLSKWYGTLSDRDKVRLGRYLPKSDTSDPASFLVSVASQANEDHNYPLTVTVASAANGLKLTDYQRFRINELLVLALYSTEAYDECVEACDAGLALLNEKEVRDSLVRDSGGSLPEDIACRNYKINVVVGIRFDYDEGDRVLVQYEKDGLLSPEDLEYRRNGIKTFRLQRTFDSIFSIKEKDE